MNKKKKVSCPVCGKLVSATDSDKVWRHTTKSRMKPFSATECPGSGAWAASQ